MKAYQIKLTLKDTHPPIWRRLIIPSGYSFSQLSVIFVFAMGWEGYHLTSHSFPRLGVEFQDDPDEDFSGWSGIDLQEASEHLIDEYLDQVKSYEFTYDFGDDWTHLVQIEKILDDYELNYPQVVKYKGNCPLDDCGGVFGYENLKDILDDPDHPEYDEMMEWSGGAPDREFDLEETNGWLAKMYLLDTKTKPKSFPELYDDLISGEEGFCRISESKQPKKADSRTRGRNVETQAQSFLEELLAHLDDADTPPEQAVQELTMMLLYLTRFSDTKSGANRAWKNYDFAAMDLLEKNGFIDQGSHGSKSVSITEEGLAFARELLDEYGILDWDKK